MSRFLRMTVYSCCLLAAAPALAQRGPVEDGGEGSAPAAVAPPAPETSRTEPARAAEGEVQPVAVADATPLPDWRSGAATADDAEPQRPAGFTASFAPPAREADGGYATPNHGIGAPESVWHVRAALNVAALNCPEAGDAAAYNAMLTAQKAALAAADAGYQARERERFGADWQARHDDKMTRLYNFWAQVPAHGEFCAVAGSVLRQAATVPAADFPAFAQAALPRLEAPFVAAYAAWDSWRASRAAWRARHAPVVIAAAAAPPVGPPQP